MPTVPFNAVLYDAGRYGTGDNAYHAGWAEIVRVTARSTDTLTITRAQEGTAAVNFTGRSVGLYVPITANTMSLIKTFMGTPAGAPTDAQYLVGAANVTLSAERVVTDTATATWDLATAGEAKLNVVKLPTGRTLSITGDLAWTSPAFDGSGNVTAAGTLATVNANVGQFGSATLVPQLTVNAKGLVTAVANVAITGGGAGSDTTAIHDNEASEISAITAKATPTTSDFALIEDAAAANVKKSVTLGAFPISTATQTALDAKLTSSGFANPSGTIDGTAANGVETTALRSDGRHALADPLTPADGTQNITGALNVSTLGTFGSVRADTNMVVNAPTGFTGRLIDLQLNGVSKLKVDYNGDLTSVAAIVGNYAVLTGTFGLTVQSTTDSTSKDTGGAIFEGGVGIEKNLHVGNVGTFGSVTVGTNAGVGGTLTANAIVTTNGVSSSTAATSLTLTGTGAVALLGDIQGATPRGLSLVGTNSGRISYYARNYDSTGNTSFYFENNRGSLATYGGLLTGGSADATGNLFGVSRADRTFLISDGASSGGLGIGTLTSDPLILGANNANVMQLHASGGVSIGNTTDPGAANLSVTGVIIAGAQVRLKGYTVATLPAGTVGDTAYVTDANASAGALAGGGATARPVFYNGAAWIGYRID